MFSYISYIYIFRALGFGSKSVASSDCPDEVVAAKSLVTLNPAKILV
jgi:hypothetical protein